MKLFGRLLDKLCNGEVVTMESPSKKVSVHVCDGWCGLWIVDTEVGHIRGWRWNRLSPRKLNLLANELRKEGLFGTATELEKLTAAMP